MQRNLLLSLLAGVVMFVWGFLSWAVLPWHMAVANKFTDEAAVSATLKANAPQTGIYFLPFAEEDHGPNQVGAFASVLPHGTEMNMGKMMAIGLANNIISAFLVIVLLSFCPCRNYLHRVGLFALTGLCIGFISHAPYWNWFGFASSYVAVIIIDTVITWTLAGLAVSKFYRQAES